MFHPRKGLVEYWVIAGIDSGTGEQHLVQCYNHPNKCDSFELTFSLMERVGPPKESDCSVIHYSSKLC